MKTMRAPVAAGHFYPEGADELTSAVDRLLDDASQTALPRPPAGLVVPHAGYAYSGPVAAAAFAALRPLASSIRRIVLLGPAHFVSLEGYAISGAESWRTPLGEVPVDDELRAAAVGAGATVDEEPHRPEHAIEVQLPFLQRSLGNGFAILPVAVGVAAPTEVAAFLEAIPSEVVVIVSTDLSHYRDAETARRLDRRTIDEVVARRPDAIHPDDACGAFALRGLVEHARRRELDVRVLDLRNSADTAGDPTRVVGYAALTVG
jgi:AmmeMemoRadiSam system protein B